MLNTKEKAGTEGDEKTLNFYAEESLDYQWTHKTDTSEVEKYTRSGISLRVHADGGSEAGYTEVYTVELGSLGEGESKKVTLKLTKGETTKEYVFVGSEEEGTEVTGTAGRGEGGEEANLIYFDKENHYYTRSYGATKTWTVRSAHEGEEECSVDGYKTSSKFLEIAFVSKSGESDEKWEHVTYLKADDKGEATVKTGVIKNEIDNIYQEKSDISGEGVTRTWTYGEWKIEEKKDGEETMTFSVDSKVTIVLMKESSKRSTN